MGRPKGSTNKTTALLKDAIIKAAEATGEDRQGKGGLIGYCTFLARKEPKAFATLLGKVLPMQVTGDDGGPLVINVVIPLGFGIMHDLRGSVHQRNAWAGRCTYVLPRIWTLKSVSPIASRRRGMRGDWWRR